MHIIIDRTKIVKNSQFGVLTVNGDLFGFTLENNEKKIAPGVYKAQVYNSPKRSGKEVILLQGVIGRTYIEMHIANYSSELDGCIAPGTHTIDDSICNSGDVFKRLMAYSDDDIMVEVKEL